MTSDSGQMDIDAAMAEPLPHIPVAGPSGSGSAPVQEPLGLSGDTANLQREITALYLHRR